MPLTLSIVMIGSLIGKFCGKENLNKKVPEIEEISVIIDKIGTHYGFNVSKN